MIEGILQTLLKTQNPDGGWGAQAGRPSGTENTALVLLGVRSAGRPRDGEAAARGLAWLRTRQRPDGSWPANDQVPAASWMTSVAALALAQDRRERPGAVRAAGWLLREEGWGPSWLAKLVSRLSGKKKVNVVNEDLRGWPWVSGTTGWVEPTAHALLVLKRLRAHLPREAVERRIADGERMLLDRMCPGGGWNYGNSRVLDTDMHPYPDTTALALIALQDAGNRPEIAVSLRALDRLARQSRSGLTLSLARLCFRLHGHDGSGLEDRLAESYRDTGFMGQTRSLSLALLSLAGGADPFHVRSDDQP